VSHEIQNGVAAVVAVETVALREERWELLREARWSLREWELHRRPGDRARLVDALDGLARLMRAVDG
jgi:hypothetical protein